jgi:hypothetical protein
MTQPPPQQTAAQQDTQLALAAAGELATAVSVAAAVASLGALFAAAGITGAALAGALSVVMGMPPDAKGFYGPATSTITRMNLMRRAQFTVASARRVQGALVQARSAGQPLGRALADAVTAERRYYGQHLMASWGRDNAAARVDSESMTWGRLLGWYTTIDSRTSPECRAANRHNFLADQMPRIGYPGMVHPSCRCLPGPPVDGAPMVGSNRPALRHRMRVYA